MKGFLKFVSIAMVCMLMFQTIGVNFASAAEVSNEGISSSYEDAYNFDDRFNEIILPDGTVEPQGWILTGFIVVGGLIAGHYFVEAVDAGVEYYTGKTPREWMMIGYDVVTKNILDFVKRYHVMEITVSAQGRVVGWKCAGYPCPQPTSAPPAE